MTKSDKMYKNSPKLEKGEDGKTKINKKSEESNEAGKEPDEASMENAGLEGQPVQAKEMQDRHMTEMKDMHGRHEKEHKDMHKRHQTEMKKMHEGDKETEDKEGKE